MGRFLSGMGACDCCSRTETCTSAAVICENLDYNPSLFVQNKYLEITSVTSDIPKN